MLTVHIGICCSAHDPAIAIINDEGELVYAEATERSLQYKRALNSVADYYPFVANLLSEYAGSSSRLVVSKSWSKAHHNNIFLANLMLPLVLPVLNQFKATRIIAERYSYMLKLQAHVFSFAGQNLIREWKGRGMKNGQKADEAVRQRFFDHHLCHAAAGAYASPFNDALVAVIDGYGQMTSTAYYLFRNSRLHLIPTIKKSKNSLGFFYSFLCSACGFNPELGEEWKVMGLAPYGKVIPVLYEHLSKLIPVKRGSFCNPKKYFDIALYDQLIQQAIAGHNYEVKDIASTGQQVFEDKIMESLNYLYPLSGNANLVLVGGCALNSSCNGKITQKTPFKNVYVYNAPGDDGTAVGAAILSFLSLNPLSSLKRDSLLSPYKGSSIDPRSLLKAVENTPYSYPVREKKYEITARLITEGYIVGWVQGRAEFGPRALGNRSILADPRKAEIKDVINKKLKYRESFRPFAPSVLEEYGEEIFENYQPSCYMDKTLKIKEHYQEKIRGVTHVNGTGRLQTVRKDLNPGFYRLISEFHKLTGVPVLLNTSFNLAGKPIVHSVDDIMASLYTSGLSAVVIEDYLFTKEPIQL